MREPSALRIALLTHSVNPRGGVVHTLELASALHAAGHDVTVMAPAARRQPLFRAVPCAVDLIEVPEHPSGTAHMIRTRIAAYRDHLAGGRARGRVVDTFDVLHAQDGIGANALADLHQAGLIRGFVRTVHHVDHFGDVGIDALQERAIRRARRVLCVSELWRDALLREYGIRASLIGNGVNLRRFSPRAETRDAQIARRLGLLPDAPLIVSVGGIERRKNTVRLVQALARLRRHLPRAQLAIVGGASLLDHGAYRGEFDAALDACALTTGPGRDVIVTGSVPDADLPALLRLANAVAFPSLCEGFGLVVLEALASGTPTVVSRIAPFTEYLTAGEVHWADPFDPQSIADALSAAVRGPKFPPPPVCSRFSWSASAAQHIALYGEFLRSDDMRCH